MKFEFEFDPAKSASNHAKHGIDFEEIQALRQDPFPLTAPARTSDEPRWIAVGQLNGKHWSAIYTIRGKTLRLISARRARKEEIKAYESP